ncbi:MAG: thermonuclease family protein [Rhodospirillales bacterium]|nr:thermonuclease family protein [Rhodospirillales bacterium]MBN8929689.1 thermonuclease family protein [Rhodospirillales bacterium]
MLRLFSNALILTLCLSAPVHAAEYTGYVVGVHDGDTATILIDRKPVKCRLASIDSPELRQPYGYRAKQALSDLIYRKAVTVDDEGGDKYGRRICHLYTLQTDVNREMVREGMAWVYRRYNHDPALILTEREARQAHRGLWVDPDPVPPWEWRHAR